MSIPDIYEAEHDSKPTIDQMDIPPIVIEEQTSIRLTCSSANRRRMVSFLSHILIRDTIKP